MTVQDQARQLQGTRQALREVVVHLERTAECARAGNFAPIENALHAARRGLSNCGSCGLPFHDHGYGDCVPTVLADCDRCHCADRY